MKDQKVAIITGGSGGIGSNIVKTLGRLGYSTIIVFNTNEKKSKMLEKEVENSIAIKCDVSSKIEVGEMVKKIIEKYGRIDVLINNASPEIKHSRFLQKGIEEFKRHIMVSYFGAVNSSKQVIPQMIRQGKGVIINIITQYVISNPPPAISDYVCAKYALLGLTRCLAVEYASKNIRVNAISPGMVETNMIRNLPPKLIELTREATPLGRLTTVEDVVNTIVFLISDESSNITGVNIPVCGGSVML